MNRIKFKLALLIGASFIFGIVIFHASPVHAWWAGGHKACTLAAVRMLPESVPAFFRGAASDLAEMSAEPDNWKSPTAPHLKLSEQPEHYIDLEFLEGKPLPETRYDLVRLYSDLRVNPVKGGFLPYAIVEGYERLMLAFRDYRNRPDSTAVQQRIIVYAGWLAHYCEDAGMPLHTTQWYDGRKGENGDFVQKGIHARIDAAPEKNGLAPEALSEGLQAAQSPTAWPVILKTIDVSHGLVDKCYELDAAGAFDKEMAKGREFTLERARASAKLTADLWYSAWVNSDPEKAGIR